MPRRGRRLCVPLPNPQTPHRSHESAAGRAGAGGRHPLPRYGVAMHTNLLLLDVDGVLNPDETFSAEDQRVRLDIGVARTDLFDQMIGLVNFYEAGALVHPRVNVALTGADHSNVQG